MTLRMTSIIFILRFFLRCCKMLYGKNEQNDSTAVFFQRCPEQNENPRSRRFFLFSSYSGILKIPFSVRIPNCQLSTYGFPKSSENHIPGTWYLVLHTISKILSRRIAVIGYTITIQSPYSSFKCKNSVFLLFLPLLTFSVRKKKLVLLTFFQRRRELTQYIQTKQVE